MSNFTQYTIRKVPKDVDAQLKAQARKRGISLNRLLLDKIGDKKVDHNKNNILHDLDWLIGSMPENEADELWQLVHEARQSDRNRIEVEWQAEKDTRE